MKSKKELGRLLLWVLVLIPLLIFISEVISSAENPELSKVVFFVS